MLRFLLLSLTALLGAREAGLGMAGVDPRKVVVTFSVSQWQCMPPAMERMAQVAHSENVPVGWILNYETAKTEKEQLDSYHKQFGDEIIMLRGAESIEDWKKLFPWARLNMTGGARPDAKGLASAQKEGVAGIWGYCDQQVGIDGITHWGCPWGLFYLSHKTPFIPPAGPGTVVGAPWTIRDLHKCYHLGNAINFGIDPIEMVRSKTLCTGNDITLFQDLYDELLANTPWNDRVYCCLHEEAGGPFVPPGKTHSVEGASLADSQAMYDMIKAWLAYARKNGATITTLPQAVDQYREAAKGKTMSSTLLTKDKMHGSINWYADPLPRGIQHGNMGPAGHFPDTLFHFDDECQLVFVHPDVLPRTVLNYRAQHEVGPNQPYPKVQVSPTLVDWQHSRQGDSRTYRYRIQSFYSMPYGVAEWGRFEGWELAQTNTVTAKIVDNQVLLVRFNIEVEKLEHNQRWQDFQVTLVRSKAANDK